VATVYSTAVYTPSKLFHTPELRFTACGNHFYTPKLHFSALKNHFNTSKNRPEKPNFDENTGKWQKTGD